MPDTHVDNLKVAVSGTPGTGTATIGSAASGCRGFVAGDDGKTFSGRWTDGTAWETATGCLYTHSGTTLTRGTLKESSTGSAISLTSAAVFECSPVADFGNKLEAALQSCVPGGRLTLESGVPVSTNDQTAKTTIYYTPFVHNIINLWDGSVWRPVTFSETSLALGTLTSGKPYDVFGYLSSGVLALESLVWTNDTTRATAVTLQDGRYCKSGDKTRLLLGTFYTTSTTTTEDSAAKRFVSNAYNKEARSLKVSDTTTHTYNSTTPRDYRGQSTNLIQFVTSLGSTLSVAVAINVNNDGVVGAGYLDTASSGYEESGFCVYNGGASGVGGSAKNDICSAGYHFVRLVQRNAQLSTAVTYIGAVLSGSFLT